MVGATVNPSIKTMPNTNPSKEKTMPKNAPAQQPEAPFTITTTDTDLVATLPDRKVTLSLALDLEEMLDVMDGIGGIDDEADVMSTLAALRRILPDGFLEQVRGVDAPISLKIFMAYAQHLGERLGKALT